MLVLALLVIVIGGWAIADRYTQSPKQIGDVVFFDREKTPEEVQAFTSADEFRQYLAAAHNVRSNNYYQFTGAAPKAAIDELGTNSGVSMDSDSYTLGSAEQSITDSVGRSSTTNVQTEGIDEPDIVKTNGENIFYSPENNYIMFERPMMGSGITEDSKQTNEYSAKTNVIDPLPINNINIAANIPEQGDLLLDGNILMVLTYDHITGYDVTDPKAPKESWKLNFTEKTSYTTARLKDHHLFLVTNTSNNQTTPCPLSPLKRGEDAVVIECTGIYHPMEIVPSDITYSVMNVNPTTGAVADQVGFVGSESNAILYMSTDNLYIAYAHPTDLFKFIYEFFSTDGKDLVSADILEQMKKINSYDISESSKINEMGTIMEDYMDSLTEEEKNRFEDGEERIQTYFDKRKRELETSGLTRIALDTLDIAASTTIAGSPLNQFSMDEYEGHLRIATTVGSGRNDFGDLSHSANDLYVLNEQLETVGQVQDLGLGERVYSARFIGDIGYLVTFRQTDPLYVFDLSDPKYPRKTGELKIPGYSSYLHPINDTLLIGVGKEDQQVKVSLFDVSDKTNPKEIAQQKLEDYWSEAIDNHHAFLLDDEKKLFFMPGSTGGYIFLYDNNTLALKKSLSENLQAKRAVYINDALYILGTQKMIVIDENTLEKSAELSLQ